jgi:hypothetical protein
VFPKTFQGFQDFLANRLVAVLTPTGTVSGVLFTVGASHDRHKDKLRQELTLLQIDQHADELEKFDVEGILSFAARVLPRASDLWVQASLDQRQRLQQLFFPDGVVFDGNRFVRTGVSTHAFRHLPPVEPTESNLASPRRWTPFHNLFCLQGRTRTGSLCRYAVDTTPRNAGRTAIER